jgi:DNA-binding CsgD family transcriptional regulator
MPSTVLGERISTVDPDRVLSARELEVLALVARGFLTGDIAAELFLSPNTVRVHMRNILGKLRANTRAHAVAIAISTGLIRVDERAIPRHLDRAGRTAAATPAVRHATGR